MKMASAALFLLLSASASEAQNMCDMTEDEAVKSPLCIRWFFACDLNLRLGPAKPPFDAIPYKDRQILLIDATYQIAEKNCAIFDYTEALAAMNAKKIHSSRLDPSL